MSRIPSALLAALGVLVILAVLPGSGLLPTATATHQGDIGCPSDPVPRHDGIIEPAEYSENFFDPRTKSLVYFTCPEDDEGIMHVGLLTPWEGWTEFRFQAMEEWNGDYNVIRMRMEGPTVRVLDGFSRATEPGYVDDQSLGGTFDVIDPSGTRTAQDHVFEFAFSLASDDVYDSQLAANGTYRFQLAAATEMDLHLESTDQFIQVGEHLVKGLWTEIELSIPTGNVALEDSEVIVSLRDGRFNPLAFRSVTVFTRTTFGYLELGRVVTNAQGLGAVEYTPRGEGDYLIGAAFAGEGGHLASVTWTPLAIGAPPAEPPSAFEGLLVIEMLIFLVVGGVWATYAYALFLIGRGLYGRGSKGGQSASGGGDESA